MTTPNIDSAVQEEQTVTRPEPFMESNGNAPDNLAEEQDIEDFAYKPIPPLKSITMTVRFQIRGQGQPLPYPLDEESTE